jgi:thiol-disulfide isomerase/thioredoxin
MFSDMYINTKKNKADKYLLFLLLLFFPFKIINVSNAAESQDTKQANGKTVQVVIKLEGDTVKGHPKVVSAENTFAALNERVKDEESLTLRQIKDNTWQCNAVEGKRYVIGWIAEKDLFKSKSKMFGYISEAFVASRDLKVNFSPGMPATFEYDLRNPPKAVKALPVKVVLQIKHIKDGKPTFLSFAGQEMKNSGILKISGLAAGEYRFSARTSNVNEVGIPAIYDDREIKIKAGSTNLFEPNYPLIDTTIEEGDVTIKGTVYGPDKKPLAKKVVKMVPFAEKGFDLRLYYPLTKTDSAGRFEFTGIRPNITVYIYCEQTSIFLDKESLAKGAIISADIVFGLRPLNIVAGQPMPEVNLEFKETGAGKISDLKGKIIVADVWATWCIPCIKTLPELNSLAKDFAENKDIVFITISKDADRAVWERVVNKSGWDSFKHSWFDKKANTYLLDDPIPFAFIVDKDEIVRAAGNGIDVKLALEKIIVKTN